MNVAILLESRFDRTPDGAVWSKTTNTYSDWLRYLDVFDEVWVVARVRDVESVSPDWKRSDGEKVIFKPIPFYLGPWQYLLRQLRIRNAVKAAIKNADAVIMRIPSPIARIASTFLRKQGRPYGVEVIGDPYEVFAPGGVKHVLRPFLRWWIPLRTKRLCLRACAASYVTSQTLQKRYPCPNFSVGVSDVVLPDTAFRAARNYDNRGRKTWNIVTVGSLAQLYKAPDVLIEAINICTKAGCDVRMVFVGDGKHRAELESRVRELGLADRIEFTGELAAGEAVRIRLDEADVFVLPSRTEGLPRALIEAMARGLPCIGSSVGGIPELLLPGDMVRPGDAVALAEKIQEFLGSPQNMTVASNRNLNKALEFREDALRRRRLEFHVHVRDRSTQAISLERSIVARL
jgi:glycosyltransferase involved in cell wall biosynthesis